MTVSAYNGPFSYIGDNSTVVFNHPELFYKDVDLFVTLDGVTQVLDADYTVSGAGNENGGAVNFVVAPAVGVKIVLQRIVSYVQETDFVNFDGNPAAVEERQFDLVVMMAQQLNDSFSRSVSVPAGVTISSNEISGTIDDTLRVLTVSNNGFSSTAVGSLSPTLDVVLTSEQSGDLLQYDGANWVNTSSSILVTVPDDSITTAKIVDLNVTNSKIADDAITTAKIADLNVTNSKIADDAITNSKIADDAITTAKIVDLNVTNSKIADDAITTAKIADANITNAKLAGNSVSNINIATNAVTTAKIQDGAVTSAKFASSLNNQLCQAWVNFNGTGTVAIRDSYNVSSVTDNGTGDYTVNYAAAMGNADYSALVSSNNGITDKLGGVKIGIPHTPTTNSLGVVTTSSTGTSLTDHEYINVIVFGD